MIAIAVRVFLLFAATSILTFYSSLQFMGPKGPYIADGRLLAHLGYSRFRSKLNAKPLTSKEPCLLLLANRVFDFRSSDMSAHLSTSALQYVHVVLLERQSNELVV